MKTIYAQTWMLTLVSLLIVLLLTTFTARANGLGYTLDWWTADGGGATSLTGSNGYSLDSTIGQPDALVWGDGNYTLIGGFWCGVLTESTIYLPLVVRSV